MIDFDQDQLERLARTDEVRLRVLSALRDRAGVSGDKDAERAMLRADAWVSILTCRARKDERSALAWSKWYAELGGVGAPGTEAKPLSAASAEQLRDSMRQSLRAAGFELVPVAPGDPRG